MIHASEYKPVVIPVLDAQDKAEIDRVQDLSATSTLNRTKIEEVGREGLVDWRTATPNVSVTLRQMEYGNMEFLRKIANKGDSVVTIPMTDFKTPNFDIVGYETDDNGTFLGTVYYPNLRTSGFGLTVGDPEALIERNFTFVGEDKFMLRKDNKYLIYKRFTLAGGTNETVTINDPVPILDPDNSGKFLFKVVRVTAGTATELSHGTGWSYDGSSVLTINGTTVAGDIVKVWYSGTSYIAGESTFVRNDADVAGIAADSVSVFLESSNQLFRLQSVGIDTTFDRFDIREVGNINVVTRGVRDVTNRITLGRILETYAIEEILRGKVGTDYGKIDIRKFASNLNLIVKIYEDNTKTNFKLGYKYIDLAPVGVDAGTPVSDYISQGNTLEGEEGFVTTVEAVL